MVSAVRAFAATYLRADDVCVGLSGGADSLALTAASLRAGLRVHAIVVDHGLQDGSAQVARQAATTARDLGATSEVVTVIVDGPGGTEAAARDARYDALDAARTGRPVLLGHTLDDQAETVLLGLGRGSGARSLAGMREWSVPWGRPLLGVRRAQTRAACDGWSLPVWDDPHNDDPKYTRVRVRGEVLPLLDDVLAGGVAQALARTASQLSDDADALDEIAARSLDGATNGGRLAVDPLVREASAIRTRVVRSWLQSVGVDAPTHRVVTAVDALIVDWRGQGPVAIGGDSRTRLVVTRRARELATDRIPR
ncbi:tRNA lysidine(34) synthetase TilS [Gordonia sp. HY002]|uniref:tRNA lysidine(34) synthetase TilS n=1 Tax=Gordonia zhenghanii TaxID=2911516 RepID=UPI001EF15027|nr:tRNA lysidine(34) synthetase TilS [Gordonia zhenghanii]MCF8571112.1 tRNA lysidine(34) synthetase TilS [Gordonia zhenghanii]MCF8604680.1 tRNA lysidine(34) synthetase TilS [Gordonia zhenghanii]